MFSCGGPGCTNRTDNNSDKTILFTIMILLL